MSDCPKDTPSMRATQCFQTRPWPKIVPGVTNPGGEVLQLLADDNDDPIFDDGGDTIILESTDL